MSKDNLPVGKAVLSLGVALDGPVLVDLTKMPHMLIGGSTGSGKTFLVLSLIKQALDKAMQVYILDMKGGVDYPRSWKGTRCSYNDSRETILSVLSQLVDTLEDRKLAFSYLEQEIGKSCPNIDIYNRLNPEHAFSRIMVVCDELAEVTDTTGMDKPNKELVNAIVGKLGTLARLGRAFGIHLVMALQRPDASALPGQIKNNADVRACGRAEMCCPLSSWIMGTLLICRRIFQAGLSPIWMAVQFSRATCSLIWTMKILTLMIRGDMTMAQKKINDYGTGIPYNEVEALARVLLPEIQAFFQSEEGQREFAEWKAHQGAHAA